MLIAMSKKSGSEGILIDPELAKQMIELTFMNIEPDYFFIRGDKVSKTINTYSNNSLKINTTVIGLEEPIEEVISNFKKLPDNTLIYAIGNQVGVGQEILEQVSGYKSNG